MTKLLLTCFMLLGSTILKAGGVTGGHGLTGNTELFETINQDIIESQNPVEKILATDFEMLILSDAISTRSAVYSYDLEDLVIPLQEVETGIEALTNQGKKVIFVEEISNVETP